MTQQHRLVTFLAHVPPNVAGDSAGVPPAVAARLVACGLAAYPEEKAPPLDFDAMDRAALLEHAKVILGLEDDPPAEVTDEQIRELLKAHVVGMPVPGPVEPGLDQLDALDRAHLEAFAITKAGFASVDPELTDDELRAQIRAKVEASVSAVEPAARKPGRARA